MAKKMKLVKILARELKEWPEENGKPYGFIAQEGDKELYGTGDIPPVFEGGIAWYRDEADDNDEFGYFGGWLTELACDFEKAVVTKKMWESERAKLAKPKGGKDGWRRHRGGKQPVANGVMVVYRMRSGNECPFPVAAEYVRWNHSSRPGDIMAYKVFEQPEKAAKEPAKEPEQSIDTPSPIKWRDRVKELDERKLCLDQAHAKHTADIAKEREELIGKLQAQGFQLIGEAAEEIGDMLDPKSWLKGDILRAVNSANEQFSVGNYYVLSKDVGTSPYCSISRDDRGVSNGWGSSNFEWHSRPSK